MLALRPGLGSRSSGSNQQLELRFSKDSMVRYSLLIPPRPRISDIGLGFLLNLVLGNMAVLVEGYVGLLRTLL